MMRERQYALVMRILRRACSALTAAAVALFFLLVPFRSLLPAQAVSPRGEGELRLHFLSVGQGDCTVVEFPDGDALVIDAGNGSLRASNAVACYLRGLDVTSFTFAVTHADADHFGGFSDLLKMLRPAAVYLPALGAQTRAYARLLAAVGEAGCPVETLVRYDVISRPSGAYLVCISPHAAFETDENESSLTLYLEYGGVRVLLCADAGTARENALLRELELGEDIFDSGDFRVRLGDIQLLKAAHHGSANASGAAWCSYLSPEAVILSCGAGNAYRHPSGDVLSRLAAAGAQIYRTDELGNIVVTIADGGYGIEY